jgi:4-diphosphocytidyl-2-C-methyl-D-erythritol kinase
VQPLPEPAPFGVLIVPAGIGLSTRDVYAQTDAMGLGRSTEDLLGRETEVRATATALPFALLHNDLEAAARALLPAIGDTLSDALAAGADHAMVTGSGPTVVGLFAGRDGLGRAKAAAADLARSGAHPRAVAAGPAGPGFGSPRPGP